MASNPPFQVEDQTDEDFFDKLVNDDDDDVDFKVTTSLAVGVLDPKFADGNESDEAKAFTNLSIGEANGNENNANNTGFDDLGGEKGFEVNGDVGEVVGDEVKAAVPVSGNAEEVSGSLVAGDSCGLDGVIKSNDGNNATEALSDCTMISKSSGSVGSGIKEVGWSAFTADSAQDASNGFGSYSDFFTELGENAGDSVGNVGGNLNIASKVVSGSEAHDSAFIQDSNNYPLYQEAYGYGAATDQAMAGQDVNSSQYWENLYPGWKYDPATGQWYQVDGFDANANIQGTMESNSAADWSTYGGKSEVSYLQKTAESAAGTVAESGTTESVTNWNQVSPVSEAKNVSDWNHVSQGTDSTGVASDWNQVSQVNDGYPSHMVFDPQYPGWYYDTNAQEWRSLESYNASAQSVVQAQDQLNQYGSGSTDTYTQKNNQETRSAYGQVTNYTASQGFSGQGQDYNLAGSFTNYNQQVSSVWQPGNVIKNESASEYSGNQRFENHQGQTFSESNHISQQNLNDYGRTVSYYEKVNKGQNDFSAMTPSQSFVSSGNLSQHFSQSRPELIEQKHVLNEYYDNQNSASFSQQHFQAANQYSYARTPGRSSAGRPPHALVTFGFGGKLIVMKDGSSFGNSSFGNQNSLGSTVSVLNLAEVVTEKADASSVQPGVCDYFRALCKQSFPSPLTGGNVGTKELNKWIDERIASFESPNMDFRRGKVLKLLLSVLKIACQYYGKLRSPFGTDTVLKENDLPESAVAQLFATAKNAAQFSQYGAVARCLQSLASEEQMRATAAEVQSLLVSGRKKEALLCAQEGQLWGPALILAAQLGNQFYVDTVKQMALRQLVAGSPLRTLCLLIAGQPADVFSMDTTAGSSMPGAMTTPQQPVQFGANSMLDCWEENLAVIASNRTKDDELVLIHLGDSLWKERSDIIAAHICYLVAEASFEPYSDSARLCLVGADHWKCPRTYASPEAIQRTEIYEYSMVLGNSQFILLPFQPYKLVYAHMLAEVGRMSDALKYCQAVLKSLKTGRAPEVETLRQSVLSLEERIKSHQQGGFSTNLAPAKLVGKLLNLFDSTANRVVGGLPPPAPSTSVGSLQGTEHPHQSMGPRVSTSQSTMAMSSLTPSASMEPISEWAADGNRKTMHTRSVSEPDFGRTPRQVDSSKDASSTSEQSKAASRFGRFGFGTQLLQKTVGLVLRPRQDRQAKLGEKNKFYYDDKLKRWVEEGAEPSAEEAALPPPPPTTTFQNGTSDYNLKTALKSEGSVSSGSPEFKSPSPTQHSPGIPPLPPTSNQFSARGRIGVRSRYVDTFNQGGGNPTNLFQSPSVPSFKPATGANPKFFVPSPVSAAERPVDNTPDHSVVSSSAAEEYPSASSINDSIQPPATPSSITMQRFGSMDNISYKGAAVGNSATTHSRRTASWSGSFNGTSSPTKRTEVKPLGEVLGMSPSSFMPTDSSLMHSSVNGGSFGDDLHEVEL